MLAIKNSFLTGTLLLVLTFIYLNFGFGMVISGSMEPAIKKNDLILIRKAGEYAPGDIVVYETDDRSVVHRIIGIDGDKIITMGDANNVADAPVGIEDVKGVVIGRLMNLPVNIGSGIQAKYVTSATGSSKAAVAGWNVSVLDHNSDTLEIMAGEGDFGENAYEFAVQSDSETTAEYHMGILLSAADEETDVNDLTLGLFRYDDMNREWYEVGESSNGVLEYEDFLPIGYNNTIFRLKALTADADTIGSYEAHIDVDVTQID